LIVELEKPLLYSTFGVENFDQLDDNVQNLAPSMVEYYLSDLSELNSDSNSYINKSNIQKTIFFDEYLLYLDYNDKVYLEFKQKETIYETESLW
jgi:hypothetical protein